MQAGWIFCKSNGDGPDLPEGVEGSMTVHLDIYRATGGPSGFEHNHLLRGAKADPSVELEGFDYEHHYHYFPYYDGQYRQITVGAPDHNHVATIENGRIQPDWYLVFWIGTDTDAAAINNDPNCVIAAVATQVLNDEGDLVFGPLDKTDWTPSERTLWEGRIANVLGLYLPEQITNGDRLIAHFIGFLLSRTAQDEMNLRGLPLVIS